MTSLSRITATIDTDNTLQYSVCNSAMSWIGREIRRIWPEPDSSIFLRILEIIEIAADALVVALERVKAAICAAHAALIGTETQVGRAASLNERVQCKFKEVLKTKKDQLIWIPHPKFEEKDRLHLPDNFPTVFHIYPSRDLVGYFGREKALRIIGRGNDFLQWLNGKTDRIDKDKFFRSSEECVMNCIDFVYLLFYQAELISKEKIAAIYHNQIKNTLDHNSSNYFYGLDLSLFKQVSQDGLNGETPMPGDVLIGFQKGDPVHVLLLSEKNIITGRYRVVNLSNTGNERPTACEVDLEAFARAWHSDCHIPITFKYCSLEAVLANFV